MIGSKVHLGIDIGTREVRAVAMRGKRERHWEVLFAGRFAYTNGDTLPDSLEEVASHLAKWFDQLPRSTHVACGLPAANTVLKIVEFPPASPADIERMVQFEAATHIPFPPEETAVGHALLGKRTADNQRVLLAGCRKEWVDALLALSRTAGCRLGRIDVSALAAMRALVRSGTVRGLYAGGALMGVHCDDDAFTVTIGDTGGIRLMRTITVPAAGLRDERTVQHLASQIRLLTQAYRAAVRETPINSLVLTGPAVPDAGMRESLSVAINLPIAVATPWNNLDTSRVPDENANVFAAATGLALRSEPGILGVDLRPPTEERSNRDRRRWYGLAFAAAVGIVLLGTATMSFRSKVATESLDVSTLESRVEALLGKLPAAKPARAGSPDIEALAQRILHVRRDGLSWLDLLRRLSSQMPKEVWILNLDCERNKSVTIQAMSLSQAAVAESVRILRGMSMFADVSLSYANAVKIADKDAYEFQAVCVLPQATTGAARP